MNSVLNLTSSSYHQLSSSTPSTPVRVMRSEPSRFKLDLSFNRHGTQKDDRQSFDHEIDPSQVICQGTSFSPSGVEEVEWVEEEWYHHFLKWNFPIRTDSPRGLSWGPYAKPSKLNLRPGRSTSPSSTFCGTKRELELEIPEPEESLHQPKRRRIIPILRPPTPLNSNLAESKLKMTILSPGFVLCTPQATIDETEDKASRLRCRLKKNKLVHIALSPTKPTTPHPPSRIVLCVSNQLKYCT